MCPGVEELKRRKNIDGLVRDLKDDDAHVRRRAAEALGKFADAASIKPLIECLSDSDKDVRGWAAFSLGKLADAGIYDSASVKPLIECLSDRDEHVHKWAAVALGKLVQPVAEWLSDCEGDVRCFATIAIGVWYGVVDVSVKPLIECLSNSDKYVRKRTGFALGELAMAGVYDASSVKPLTNLLSDNDKDVSNGAAYALGKLANTGVYDWASVKPMVKLLVDHDRREHWVVVAYRELVYATSVKPLIRCLADGDEDVCKGAAWALGDLADAGIYDSPSVKPLVKRLMDGEGNVRKEEVWAVLKELGKSGDDFASARPRAKPPVRNGVPTITISDLADVGVFNAAHVELLTKLLTNYNLDMRYRAAVTLKKLANAGVTNIPPDHIISAVINAYHKIPPHTPKTALEQLIPYHW